MWSREASSMEAGTRYKSKNKPPTDFTPGIFRDVATYMDLDSDLWVFRRFGKLHLFNILCIQQKLTMLEYKLEQHISGAEEDEDFDATLRDMQHNLKEYDAALSAQARFKSYRKPENHSISLMKEWAGTTVKLGSPLRCALDVPRKDLASIAAGEKSWTHRFIDKHDSLRRVFKEKSEEEALYSTLIYSEDNVRRAEAVFIHASFCLLLIGPIIGLSYLDGKAWKLLLLVFALLAASVVSVGFLNTTNKTSLALVAGYAAILVVFLSNDINN